MVDRATPLQAPCPALDAVFPQQQGLTNLSKSILGHRKVCWSSQVIECIPLSIRTSIFTIANLRLRVVWRRADAHPIARLRSRLLRARHKLESVSRQSLFHEYWWSVVLGDLKVTWISCSFLCCIRTTGGRATVPVLPNNGRPNDSTLQNDNGGFSRATIAKIFTSIAIRPTFRRDSGAKCSLWQ